MLKGLVILPLLGRLMIAAIFIFSGITKATAFAGTAGYIASKGLPVPDILAGLTIALEVGGGILIVFGFFTRWVALLFAIFCVATAVIFHNFWGVPPEQMSLQRTQFLKNIAIAGGFLFLAHFGAGPIAVDKDD
jgi:putative oxidoreductase